MEKNNAQHVDRGSTLADVGERWVLKYLREQIKSSEFQHVRIGIGDDAAELRVDTPVLWCQDTLVEGFDFDFQWARPEEIGAKAAAVNLSDIAAMGGLGRALLLSVSAPPTTPVCDLLDLIEGVHACGRRFCAPLVGGDLSASSSELSVTVSAMGAAPKQGVWRRNLGMPGDRILVSGTLGGAAAGLFGLIQRVETPPPEDLRRAQCMPQPRLDIAQKLIGRPEIKSVADISDGLSSDVFHVISAGFAASLESEKLPISESTRRYAAHCMQLSIAFAMHGGEDFELVFAVDSKGADSLQNFAQTVGVTLCDIGEIVEGEGLYLDGKRLDAEGYQHFKA